MVRPVREDGAPRAGARAAGALVLVFALGFVVAKYLGTANPWKLTHWLFRYDLGFVKRGLVGTIASWLSPSGTVTAEWIVVTSLAIAALFVAALAALAWPVFTAPGRHRAFALGCCALAAPGFGFLLSDLGRFDVLNYALCLLAILAARATDRLPYPVFLALASGMLLIHEAALLLAVPVLFVAHLHTCERLHWLAEPARWPALAARLAPLLALFAGITLFGGSDLPLGELVARLATHGDFPPAANSAYVLVRGLDSNFAQIMGWQRAVVDEGGALGPRLGPVRFEPFFGILPFAVAQLVLAHIGLRALARERRRAALWALHLCFLAPLPLLAIGVDWGRWAALASAHCATLTLLFAPELPDEGEAPLSGALAVAAAVFVIAAAGASYKMEGARSGSADSPQAGAQRWLQDAGRSDPWYRAYVTP